MTNAIKFNWTAKSERAAVDVAEDRIPDVAIAKRAGIVVRTLARWKTEPEFMARVSGHVTEFRKAARSQGIAIVEERVRRQNATWSDLRQIVKERQASAYDQHTRREAMLEEIEAKRDAGADDDELKPLLSALPEPLIPGQDTGLIVKTYKMIGQGSAARMIAVWEEDTALLAELRNLETLTAKELGQAVDKQEHSGPNGGPIETTNANLTDEARADRITALLNTAGTRRAGSTAVPN